MEPGQGTIAAPKITGTFAMRPLELATWMVAVSLIFALAMVPHVGSSGTAGVAPAVARMNVNTAPLEELTTLPGMTQRRARAVIAAREKAGGFRRVSDLTSVPGITGAYLRGIENLVEAR